MARIYYPRTFVIGDLHGNHKALRDLLDETFIRYDEDTLICLGNIVDGWPDTDGCFDALRRFDNLVIVRGDRDQKFLEWLYTETIDPEWCKTGGAETLQCYGGNVNNVPQSHIDMIKGSVPYYVQDNKLFIHGSFYPDRPIDNQDREYLRYGRDIFFRTVDYMEAGEDCAHLRGTYDEVYVGHTTTEYYAGTTHPIIYSGIHLMNTGAGNTGRLTLMNIETKGYVQSELVTNHYTGKSNML